MVGGRGEKGGEEKVGSLTDDLVVCQSTDEYLESIILYRNMHKKEENKNIKLT